MACYTEPCTSYCLDVCPSVSPLVTAQAASALTVSVAFTSFWRLLLLMTVSKYSSNRH